MRVRSLAGCALALLLLTLAPPAPAVAVSASDCDPTDPICAALRGAQGDQADNAAQLDAIKNKIQDIQQKIAALTAQLAKLQAQRAQQEAQIARTQAEIEDLARQIRLAQAQVSRQEAHISVREQYLDQRVRAMDKHGRLDYLELVVTSRDFNQLIDRLMVMQDLIRGDQRTLESLKQDKAKLQQLRSDLDHKKAEQEVLLAQQQAQEAALQRTIADQQALLDYQRQLDAQYEVQRRQLEAQQAEIAARIQQLQQALDNEARGLGGGTGQFLWPEQARYPITQPYGPSSLPGEPPYNGYRHFHTGIDIGGPPGTPIIAADAGIASMYATGYGYGNYIIIIHGNGYSTLYGHMSGFALRDTTGRNEVAVTRGQVIGYEGSTGYSTGPHLHFEIRLNGAYQNPCAYLGC